MIIFGYKRISSMARTPIIPSIAKHWLQSSLQCFISHTSMNTQAEFILREDVYPMTEVADYLHIVTMQIYFFWEGLFFWPFFSFSFFTFLIISQTGLIQVFQMFMPPLVTMLALCRSHTPHYCWSSEPLTSHSSWQLCRVKNFELIAKY